MMNPPHIAATVLVARGENAPAFPSGYHLHPGVSVLVRLSLLPVPFRPFCVHVCHVTAWMPCIFGRFLRPYAFPSRLSTTDVRQFDAVTSCA